jgi:hypothetical protein
MDERFGLWIAFRIIFAIIIASIVFSIISNVVFERATFYNWFWNLLIILFVVWLVSWLFRWPMGHYWYHEREVMILRRRYARGEISEAQFKKMMKVLKEIGRDSRTRRR